MSVMRWDPFRDMLTLREAMQELLEQSYVNPGTGSSRASGNTRQLPLDVQERDNNYVLKASLPGVNPSDVHVTVHGDTVTIRAEMRGEQEQQSGGYLLRERHSGVLQRTVTLPTPIESEEVDANYEHGVLTLTLPKSRASMPRRVQIRAGGGSRLGSGGQQGADQGQGQGSSTQQIPVHSGGQQAGTQSGGQQTGSQSGSGQAGTSQGGSQQAGGQRQHQGNPNEAGRLPSLNEQTPGLDQDQEQRTLQDAQAFYQQGQGQQEQGQGQQGQGSRGSSGNQQAGNPS